MTSGLPPQGRRPRVSIVTSFSKPHSGGVENVVDWSVSALRERGWDVRLITSVGEGDLVVPILGRRPLNIPLPRNGVHSFRTLQRVIADSDVVIVHNFFWPLSLLALSVARRLSLPAVVMVHGNTVAPPTTPAVARLVASLQARHAASHYLSRSTVIGLSRSTLRFLSSELGVQAEYVPLPLDLGRLPDMRAMKGDVRSEMRLIFCGRLVELKNPVGVAEAVRQAASLYPVRLEVYGEGPLISDMQRLSGHTIRLMGSLPHGDVLKAIHRSHCLVSASVVESGPLSVLEALGMGVPAMSTDVGDAGDYLGDGLSDLLLRSSEPSEIVMALSRVRLGYGALARAVMDRAEELRAIHSPSRSADLLEAILIRAMGPLD